MKTSLSFNDIHKLRKGVDAYDIFEFPFLPDVAIAIRVLTQDELVHAKNAGEVTAKEELKDPDYAVVIEYASREILTKAVMIAPEPGVDGALKPFFSCPKDVGQLRMDEITMLLEHYNEVQEKYSPLDSLETPEQFDELIDEVKKKSHHGQSLSTFTLRKLVAYLVNRSEPSQNDNDSTSTPVKNSEESMKAQPSKIQKGIQLKNS